MKMDTGDGTRTYVLGHSDRELARLERQSGIFAEATEEILRRAGIGPGMRVLDVGCGAGDVSMLAARLVGPSGSVLGVDRVDAALETARRRATVAGLANIAYAPTDITTIGPGEFFDAVIGRFILLYIAAPSVMLRGLARRVRPGGTVAFIEMDIDHAGALPEIPLLNRCLGWITETYRRVGIEPNMGSRLFGAFRGAGLTPKLHGTSRIEGGPDADVYDFAAETLRSLLPRMAEMGVTTAQEVDVDTFAERLKAEALAGDHCLFMPRIVGAWARTAA